MWKKAIRVINHELNNTIAPITLALSLRAHRAADAATSVTRSTRSTTTIEERLAFLRAFLESYAQFARLPAPRKERDVVARAARRRATRSIRFISRASRAADGLFDRAQMQQVLINLVKNAHESGSDPDEVAVSIDRVDQQTRPTRRSIAAAACPTSR